MRDFRKLAVWEKAHKLTLEIYRVTKAFPDDERFGLTSQLRRASASVGANLAEGSGRFTDGDFKRFVDIASGSACEVEYHLILSHDLGILQSEKHTELDDQINEIKKMLASLARRLHQTKANS